MVNGGWYIYQSFEGRFTWTEWFSLRFPCKLICPKFVHQKTYCRVKSTLFKRNVREKKFWTSFKLVALRWAKKCLFSTTNVYTIILKRKDRTERFLVRAAIIFDGTVNIGTIIPSKRKKNHINASNFQVELKKDYVAITSIWFAQRKKNLRYPIHSRRYCKFLCSYSYIRERWKRDASI